MLIAVWALGLVSLGLAIILFSHYVRSNNPVLAAVWMLLVVALPVGLAVITFTDAAG